MNSKLSAKRLSAQGESEFSDGSLSLLLRIENLTDIRRQRPEGSLAGGEPRWRVFLDLAQALNQGRHLEDGHFYSLKFV